MGTDSGDEELPGGLFDGSSRLGKLKYVGLNDGDAANTSDLSSTSSGGGGGGKGAVGEAADKASDRLAIFGLLNLGYVALQLTGAMAFSSLALMSDGFHNLSDVAAIGMAMYIHRLQRKRCPENEEGGTDQLPFGYKRSEVIGGLMNSVALVALSAYITLSAIPRLFVPKEVTDGWSYILLAFGGVLVNLVGVLFFMYSGEDGHGQHCAGFLTAHNHSHDHGHEIPATLGSIDLLALVDPDEVPTSVSPSQCAVDDDEEISMVLTGSDPIGRGSLRDTAVARQAFMARDDMEFGDEEGGLVGGVRESSGGGDTRHRHDKEGHACSHSHSHSHVEHSLLHEQMHQVDCNANHNNLDDAGLPSQQCQSQGMDACCSNGSARNGIERSHDCGNADNGHRRVAGAGGNGWVEITSVHKKYGAAAVGGSGDDDHGGGGSGCPPWYGGGGGRCKEHGHGGKSMNLTAVLVHAITDAISSAVVCAQGIMAFSFGKPTTVDWTDYLDPLTSIFLSLFMVYCALPVVKDCWHVLLEGTPRSTDLPRLKKELLKVQGISSIQSLSVTQLNSEEPFVASLTLVAEAGTINSTPRCQGVENSGGEKQKGELLVAGTVAVVESVRRVLAGHNIGRNTVEIVLRPGDAARGTGGVEGAGYGASESGDRDRGKFSSAADEGEEFERKHLVEGSSSGNSGGKSNGGHHRHSNEKCSGHGHSHAHVSTVDLV